jgi:transcriptional regulator with XRE-family HTH domain
MGHARPRPKHLAEKLLQIRRSLGMSQVQLARVLGIRAYNDISKYELNKNEPPLTVLLAYSRLAEISVEQIIDDNLSLPYLLASEVGICEGQERRVDPSIVDE